MQLEWTFSIDSTKVVEFEMNKHDIAVNVLFNS